MANQTVTDIVKQVFTRDDYRELAESEVAALLPFMTAAESRELEASFLTEGFDPEYAIDLVRNPETGAIEILDGRNRNRVWGQLADAGRVTGSPWFREVEVPDDPAMWVMKRNKKKRHLAEAQLAAVAVKLKEWYADAAKKRQLAGLKQGTELPLASREANGEESDSAPTGKAATHAAEELGTSKASVERAAAVKAADPELFDLVFNNQLGVKPAYDAVKKLLPEDPELFERVKGLSLEVGDALKMLAYKPENERLFLALKTGEVELKAAPALVAVQEQDAELFEQLLDGSLTLAQAQTTLKERSELAKARENVEGQIAAIREESEPLADLLAAQRISHPDALLALEVRRESPELFESILAGRLNAEAAMKQLERERRDHERRNQAPPVLPEGKYNVVYADPPWMYSFSQSDSRQVENQYPTMDLEALCALQVPQIAHDDCVLFLWRTAPKQPEAHALLAAWGFTYKTEIIWEKVQETLDEAGDEKATMGMGYYARNNHEVLVIATKGAPGVPLPENRPPCSVIRAPRGRHSEKPAIFAASIEKMYPQAKKIELFCRSPRPGWDVWGNEASVAAHD